MTTSLGQQMVQELVNNLNKNVLQTEKRNFYSQGGWAGNNYSSSRSVAEIAKIIRRYVKKFYPEYKFSITKQHYNSLRVALMSGPVSPFATPDVTKMQGEDFRFGEEYFMRNWKQSIENGYHGVNHYYIDNSRFLTEEAKVMFKDIVKFIQSFNYDDSEAMTDYFDTNFYLNVEIGKWDRPFITTN